MDYSRDLLLGKVTAVQILLDGADSNTASIAMGYAQGVVQTYARQARDDAQSLRTGSVMRPAVDAQVRVWYNTDLVSRNFIVPGLIGVITMIIAALLTSLTIAREWENGTMEQLLSTPVRPIEMALGKLSAHFLLGLTDMLIALFVGVVIFKVPLRGSVFLLLFSACVFLYGARAGPFISHPSESAQRLSDGHVYVLPAGVSAPALFIRSRTCRGSSRCFFIIPARYFIDITKESSEGFGTAAAVVRFLLLILYAVGVFRPCES